MTFFDTLHSLEMTWITSLQTIRTPWLDSIMRALNLIDTWPSWLFITLGVLFLYHHKIGLRMLFALLLSAVLNQDLKALFAQPRPFNLDPSVAVVYISSFGFPSGAAQTSIVLAALLALFVNKKWCWWASTCFVLIIGFSRIYLGVHFISDVIGGWIAGIFLLTIYLYALPFIEKILAKSSPLGRYGLLTAICIALAALCVSPKGILIGLFGFGVGLGVLWSTPLDTPHQWSKKILRLVVVGAGITILLGVQRLLLSNFFLGALYPFISGVWVGYGGIAVSKRLEKMIKT